MADVRLPASLPTVTAPAPARSTEAVRAAQRAFFNTALANAEASAGAGAATPAPGPSVAAAPPPAPPLRTSAPAADAPAPSRPLRPGSLLDIRI